MVVYFGSSHGQVGDSGSGGREDGHTTTSNGKQETEQHIPDVMMEGEQLQLEEEQPEVCIVCIMSGLGNLGMSLRPQDRRCVRRPLNRMVMSYKQCIAWHQLRALRVLR